MSRDELINSDGFILHHTAYFRGYVSRKNPPDPRPYTGEFGKGYALLSPNWDSSRYSYVSYYIAKEASLCGSGE